MHVYTKHKLSESCPFAPHSPTSAAVAALPLALHAVVIAVVRSPLCRAIITAVTVAAVTVTAVTVAAIVVAAAVTLAVASGCRGGSSSHSC